MDVLLQSFFIFSTDVAQTTRFLTQVFDVEIFEEGNRPYFKLGPLKLYIIQGTSSTPQRFELFIQDDLKELKEKIDFYRYRSTLNSISSVEWLHLNQQDVLLVTDNDGHQWLLSNKIL